MQESDKKTLCWVYPHLKFWMGGTKFLYEVTTRLTKSYNVIIVCNLGDKKIIQTFRDGGIKVITTSWLSTNSSLYWLFSPVSYIFDLLSAVRNFNNSDYIISSLFPSNFITALYCKLSGKKYYYFCYEPFPFFHNKDFINSYKLFNRLALNTLALINRRFDIWATQNAYKIFSFDKVKYRMIKDIYNRSSIITQIGVNTDIFRKYSHNPISEKLGDKILITHSTDYTPSKNTDLVIKLIKIISTEYPKIHLLITSTRPKSDEKRQYEKLIKDLQMETNVTLSGFISQKQLAYYYSASLCYITLSTNKMHSTNMPVKEALACETPVIRFAVTDEDVKDNESGFIVRKLNYKEIADKIIFLIKYPKIRNKMGANGRKYIKKYFNWNSVVKIIIKNLNYSQS